jgi:phosphoglycerate-specific signal transduction histidine kinase
MELSYQKMWGISPEQALAIPDNIMESMRKETARLSETVSVAKVSRPTHTDYLSLVKDLLAERRRLEQISILSSLPSLVSSHTIITEKNRANMNRRLKPITIRPRHLRVTSRDEAVRLTRKV